MPRREHPRAEEAYPPVPLTIEGASVLHQMMRIRWREWKALVESSRSAMLGEADTALAEMRGRTAVYSMLGHKGDLMLVHFRSSFDELNQVELRLAQLGLWDYLEPSTSYLSVVELGLYESSVKVYSELMARGVEPFSAGWDQEIEATLERQRAAMRPRLYPEIPASRYLCFYPMDRKRGEVENWYREPMLERQRMMREHGVIGRRYAGTVTQVISGSIGFDDWEWGVDLFAGDPLVFKKLIYEMRFDEASASYAAFGPFYVGLRAGDGGLAEIFATSAAPPAAS